jgi:hypothetical protein
MLGPIVLIATPTKHTPTQDGDARAGGDRALPARDAAAARVVRAACCVVVVMLQPHYAPLILKSICKAFLV